MKQDQKEKEILQWWADWKFKLKNGWIFKRTR